MFLVWLQIFNDGFLLSKFGSEEFRITLEFIRQSLLWLIQELSFVIDSLQINFIDFSLDVVEMESSLILFVFLEHSSNIWVHSLLFLIQLVHNVVIESLLLSMNTFDLSHLLSERPKLLNFWCKLCFSFLHLRVYLLDCCSNLLKGLIFLVIKQFFLIGDTLDFIFNICVTWNTLSPFKVFHEFTKIICSTF